MRRAWVSILWATAAVAAQLPFIQDDYPKARAEAKERNLPLFVKVWAPW